MVDWKAYVKDVVEKMGAKCCEMPGTEEICIISVNPIFAGMDEDGECLKIRGAMLPALSPVSEDEATVAKLLPIARQVGNYIVPDIACDLREGNKNIDVWVKVSLKEGLPEIRGFAEVLHSISAIQKKFKQFLDRRLPEDEMELIIFSSLKMPQL